MVACDVEAGDYQSSTLATAGFPVCFRTKPEIALERIRAMLAAGIPKGLRLASGSNSAV